MTFTHNTAAFVTNSPAIQTLTAVCDSILKAAIEVGHINLNNNEQSMTADKGLTIFTAECSSEANLQRLKEAKQMQSELTVRQTLTLQTRGQRKRATNHCESQGKYTGQSIQH